MEMLEGEHPLEGPWNAYRHREHHFAIHQEQGGLVVLVRPISLDLFSCSDARVSALPITIENVFVVVPPSTRQS